MVLWSLIKKEWLLLLRDWHALLLLFVMPTAFILVMSLALQNAFSRQQGVDISYYIVNADASTVSAMVVKKLRDKPQFRALNHATSRDELTDRVRQGKAQFMLIIPDGFGPALTTSKPEVITVLVSPDVMPAVRALFTATIRDVLGHVYLHEVLAPLQSQIPDIQARLQSVSIDTLLHSQSLYSANGQQQRPNAVQQNVPAWLLFAMFFIAIPLSTTWIGERREGTYSRLRNMGVHPSLMMLGKLLPYWIINLIQVALMVAVGVWLLPIVGASSLTLGNTPVALGIIALAASFAAVAFGLLIARLASTSEQATIITGIGNLLMAAVGGVMVPRFVMPHAMQVLSQYSPMAWGLDGFLAVFLRDTGIAGVAPQATKLFVFGIICLVLAGWRQRASGTK